MPPPELPRDAPVGRLLERGDREAVLRLRGGSGHAPLLSAAIAGAAGSLHRAPPLQRDERLDARMAALAGADRVAVRLALLHEAALVGPRDHACARLVLRQTGEIAGDLAHAPVPADGHRLGETMVAPDLEVERVVTGRDLESARAELAIDALVGDDRDAELRVRNDHLTPDRVAIPRIVRDARRRRRRRGSWPGERWRSRRRRVRRRPRTGSGW